MARSTTDDQKVDVIEEFLDRWKSEIRNSYQAQTEYAERLCKAELSKRAVNSSCHFRVKDDDSLRKKLYGRHQKKPYIGEASIKDDIRDFGGLRIALYNKNDIEKVYQMIEDKFFIHERIKHPPENPGTRNALDTRVDRPRRDSDYQKHFEGYSAFHYQVKLRPSQETEEKRFDPEKFLEIQVTSILRHVWAAVEHDIEYKQAQGEPSDGERRVLDSLNGLVQAGDILIEQLLDLKHQRITQHTEAEQPINNDWQVAGIIDNWLKRRFSHDHTMDNNYLFLSTEQGKDLLHPKTLRALKKLLELEEISLNTPTKLRNRLEQVNFDPCLRSRSSNATDATGLFTHTRVDQRGHNVAICIMHDILTKRTIEEVSSDDEEALALVRLKIIGSTMIWLDELFSDLPHLKARVFGDLGLDTKVQLRWLLKSGQRTFILTEEQKPSRHGQNSIEQIEGLWSWLSGHQDETMRISFGLARSGVLKNFSNDIKLLPWLWGKWRTYLEEIKPN